MIRFVVLVASVLIATGGSAALARAQGTACLQPLAAVSVPERSYALVNAKEFEGRVYLYAPEIQSSRGTFEPFQLWVVEGIYGRPFVQNSGPMDQAAFDRLRSNANIRATGLRIARSAESTRAMISRRPFILEVAVSVSPGGVDAVSARVCRPR